MAVFDYDETAADALELIAEFGREFTFSRQGRTAADSNKPWRGRTTSAGADEPLEFEDVMAAFVPATWKDKSNQVVKEAYATLLVAHGAFPEDTEVDTVRTLDAVTDGTWTWRIKSVQPLIPGSTPVIYTMELES